MKTTKNGTREVKVKVKDDEVGTKRVHTTKVQLFRSFLVLTALSARRARLSRGVCIWQHDDLDLHSEGAPPLVLLGGRQVRHAVNHD